MHILQARKSRKCATTDAAVKALMIDVLLFITHFDLIVFVWRLLCVCQDNVIWAEKSHICTNLTHSFD